MKYNNNNSGAQKRLRTPFRDKLEMYGKVIQLMGANQVNIMCEDGVERNCRIPGKMFKHIWLKPADIVIIQLWDFQPSKANVVWRFLGFQKTQLEKRRELNKLYEHTHDDIVNYHRPRDDVQNNNVQKEEVKEETNSETENTEDKTEETKE